MAASDVYLSSDQYPKLEGGILSCCKASLGQ